MISSEYDDPVSVCGSIYHKIVNNYWNMIIKLPLESPFLNVLSHDNARVTIIVIAGEDKNVSVSTLKCFFN